MFGCSACLITCRDENRVNRVALGVVMPVADASDGSSNAVGILTFEARLRWK